MTRPGQSRFSEAAVARTASITEAKAQLSRLVDEVERGGEVIIQRGGSWRGRRVARRV